MKRVIAILFSSIFMIFACSSAPQSEQSTDIGEMAQVVRPAIPKKLSFAGEKVPLDKYDVRESLQRELLVTSYLHSRTFLSLLNTQRYFEIIVPIMERYKVPEDFKYLCMAESGLDPDVVSYAGAGGLWQIMPATGRSYGLEVGKQVDERYHIEKCTEAACKYLLDSYERFGSWTMAAAAYNLGDAGVKRRIEAQQVTDYYDSFFPAETLRYVYRILSLKLLTENPEEYGYQIAEEEYYKPLTDYRTVETNEAEIDWCQFAIDNGTTYKMLRELNHWIRDYKHSNSGRKTYEVKIPNAKFRDAH